MVDVWKRIDVPPLAVMDIYICIQVVRNFICGRTVNSVSLNEQKNIITGLDASKIYTASLILYTIKAR